MSHEKCILRDNGTVNTCKFRLAGPLSLIEPDEKGKYKLRALFPADADLSELKKLAEKTMMDKWGKKPGGMKSPFHDQGDKDGYEGYVDGAVYINMSTKIKPGLVDSKGGQIFEKEELYAGCWVIANVHFYAYDGVFDGVATKGLTCSLNHVMKVGDDEPFAGARESAGQAFDLGEADQRESEGGGIFD